MFTNYIRQTVGYEPLNRVCLYAVYFCLRRFDCSSLWLAEISFTSFKDDYFSIKSVDNIVT